MASNSPEPTQSSAASPDDEPSVAWGWHGGFPKGTIVGGIITIIVLIALIPGPYQSKTQYLWLIGIALVVLFAIIGHVIRARNAWRR